MLLFVKFVQLSLSIVVCKHLICDEKKLANTFKILRNSYSLFYSHILTHKKCKLNQNFNLQGNQDFCFILLDFKTYLKNEAKKRNAAYAFFSYDLNASMPNTHQYQIHVLFVYTVHCMYYSHMMKMLI